MTMLALLSLLLAVTVPAGDKILFKADVKSSQVTLRLYFAPSPDNVWYCSQFKSLAEDWTPRHCGPVAASTDTHVKEMTDVWPRMPTGAYDVTVELFRDHWTKAGQQVTEFDAKALRIVVP